MISKLHKVLLVSLSILLVASTFLPQISRAHAYDQAVADYEAATGITLADRQRAWSSLGSDVLELAAGFGNPAVGMILSALAALAGPLSKHR